MVNLFLIVRPISRLHLSGVFKKPDALSAYEFCDNYDTHYDALEPMTEQADDDKVRVKVTETSKGPTLRQM